MKREPTLEPPRGGDPPPEVAVLESGATIELRPLAEEVCRRYRDEFPDESGRYGEAGASWCVHDNQHILNWAVLTVTYASDLLAGQIAWLAGVLAARNFPAERLARDLELAAEVMEERHPGAPAVAEALRRVSVKS